METIRVYTVDAFTDEPLAGNPAGVVPDAAGLGDEQLQAIARELAVSETAFLTPGDQAPYRVRYFTPTQEVDACGHATVAAVSHLRADDAIEDRVTLETNAGLVEVTIDDDGLVWTDYGRPSVESVDLPYDRVADALGVDRVSLAELGADLPLAVSTVGLSVLVVPCTYLGVVGDADPDQAEIAALTDEVGASGLYLCTFDTLASDATMHGRMFAPGAGIPEDPVTGTASGAAGAYLDAYGAFDAMPDPMRFEQGHFLDRPGHVHVSVSDSVQVGGQAVTALEGSLAVPDETDDEILQG
jgi:PhzF family phenazine biosynthesis protein